MLSSIAWAETNTNADTDVSVTTDNSMMPIKPVNTEDIASKFVNLLMSIHDAIGGFIIPLAIVSISILAIVFIVGSMLGVGFLRNVGWIGLLACCFGIFLYAAAPVIASVFYGAGASLN